MLGLRLGWLEEADEGLQDEGQVEDHGGARQAGVQLLEGLGRRSKGLVRVRVRARVR